MEQEVATKPANMRRQTRIRWGIGQRLSLGFAGLIVLIVAVGAGALFGLHVMYRSAGEAASVAGRRVQLADSIQITLLEARQAQDNYLLGYKRIGFEAARATYPPVVQQQVDLLKQDAAELQVLATSADERVIVAEIMDLADAYLTQFLETIDLVEQRGHKDDGLEGVLRDAIHALEDAVQSEAGFSDPDAILVTLLQLRRREKDYLLRGEAQYVDMVHELASQLRSQVTGPGAPVTRETSYGVFVDVYLGAFDALVETDVAVNQSLAALDQAQTAAEARAADAEALAYDEQRQALDRLELSRNAVLIGVSIGIFGSIGLGAVTARATSRSIVNPIRQLTDASRAVAAGDLSVQISAGTHDETGVLAESFNQMTSQVRDLVGTLEQRVADRTRSLQAAAEVSRATTSVLDPDQLVSQVVDQIRDEFDLYYVGLFLLDNERRYAVLQAGTGQAGRQMLSQRHRLPVGGESMIGQCVATEKARVAVDVGQEAVHFDNPLLPDTRSELALPLRSRSRTIGAMTVQSTQPAAFDDAEIAILQSMADQVAIAIDNAHLLQQVQAGLEAERRAYGELSYRAWSQTVGSRSRLGFLADDRGVRPVAATGDAGNGDGASRVGIPIVVQGSVIGEVVAFKPETVAGWDEQEAAMLATLTEQLGTALESARLHEDARARAVREELIGEIAAELRRSLDVDAVLQAAVREIGESLGLAEVEVRVSGPVSAGLPE